MRKAVYAGSFDPPTRGHLDIIRRARRLCDELIVLVTENRAKTPFFLLEERRALLQNILSDDDGARVEICPPETLLADFLKKRDINIVVRGVRNERDFSYEADMARINQMYYPEAETIFLSAQTLLSTVSSSAVRELALYHADISAFVPGVVARAIAKKLFS